MSLKILLVDDEGEIRDILSVILEGDIDDLEIIEASSGNKAIEELKRHRDIDLVFCDYRMSDGNGGVVFSHIKSTEHQCAFILVSTENPQDHEELKDMFTLNPLNGHLDKPFEMNDVSDFAKKVLSNKLAKKGASQLKLVSNSDPEKRYIKLDIHRFLRLNKIDCDVFIKLSDKKFVKVLSEEDAHDLSPLKKYLDRDLDYVFLKSDDYEKFISALSCFLIDKLEVAQDPQQRVKLELESIEQIHKSLKELGIEQSVIELTAEVVNSITKTVKKNQHLCNYLSRLSKEKGYAYLHAQLTAYSASAIGNRMDWGSKSVIEKLSYAALFQDISLDNDELCKIRRKSEQQFENLEYRDQEIILKHPLKSADMIEKFEHFPEESLSMIFNHHELPNGEGFPRGLSGVKISPLDSIFIVAGQFAHRMIENNLKAITIPLVLDEMREFYNRGNFKRTIKAFREVFIGKDK